ncbi:hypothetical protein HUJ04_001245 [Dendroctonus ponderosae]|uniref:Phospholipase B1, membrane-associated n=1 Tax=Dendroctonus ponderosae TaxID=77166 RepID=A0AAR5PSD8_DENPD|nr:hypothetical protein HUJ04_001245 [Dendroctonus ponderosae]
MQLKVLIPLLVACAPSSLGRDERTALDNFVPFLRIFKSLTNQKWEAVSRGQASRRSMALKQKRQHGPKEGQFPCSHLDLPARSQTRPQSAHQLRPGDIDVVGAIGDSLTAGFGVEVDSLLALLHEARGSSFSIGGAGTWQTHLTLPNILKQFNPYLYGYSLNAITTDSKSKFNVAEGGAISNNMPFMARVLVDRIKRDKHVDLENDWKMISIFIGHNDLCSDACYKRDFQKVLANHEADIVETLRTFRNHLPRTVINLIPPIHLKILLDMTDKPASCIVPHIISCPCLIGLPHRHLVPQMMRLMDQWQALDLQIANYPEFDSDQFTIIAHKFTLNFTLPRLENGGMDYGYTAADCFHASQRGHAKAANDLWNSLLEPYGQKTTNGGPEFARFLCPSPERPYMFTQRNSNRQ